MFMENKRKLSVPGICMLLLPVLAVVALLVPALNPGRYISFTAQWSYLEELGRAMEIDQLFSKAYSGIRELFASNALLTFCTFLAGVGAVVELVGSILVTLKESQGTKLVRIIGNALTICASAALLLGSLNANMTCEQRGYDIAYLYPLGAFVQLGLGVAMLALMIVERRKRMREDHTYIPMTKMEKRENLKGYAFISPYIIGFTVFTAFPMIFSAFSSFTYYNITAVQKWYGVTNYTNLFVKDPLFWQSLGNTLYYVVFSVPLVIILALMLALLMNTRVKFMGFFRTIYYLPSILSGVAVYLLWQWIFDPGNGLLNNALALFGIKGPAWLYDAAWTKPALIIMRLWSTGGTMILLLAALQNVPVDLYEAGELDGAIGFKKFWHITLPMISPTLFFVMVTGISGAFQVYDSAYIMVENGGPGKSLMFYNLYLFNTAFKDQSMGKASAMAWVLFAIIMIFTLVQQVASKKWVYYEGGTEK